MHSSHGVGKEKRRAVGYGERKHTAAGEHPGVGERDYICGIEPSVDVGVVDVSGEDGVRPVAVSQRLEVSLTDETGMFGAGDDDPRRSSGPLGPFKDCLETLVGGDEPEAEDDELVRGQRPRRPHGGTVATGVV